MKNVGNVLKASGTSWDKVVKVNIYLKDMNNFAPMNAVYEKVRIYLDHIPPLFDR